MKLHSTINTWLFIIFVLFLPFCIFLAPIAISIVAHDPWYNLLFIVSWLPAVIVLIVNNIFFSDF